MMYDGRCYISTFTKYYEMFANGTAYTGWPPKM